MVQSFTDTNTLITLTTMALDNPSYFTIPGGPTTTVGNRGGRFSLLRKHVKMGTASSSASTANFTSNKIKKSERYSVLPSSSSSNIAPSHLSEPASLPPPESSQGFRHSFRSLLHSTSVDSHIQTQMLVLGMPRPSDIAPSVQQKPNSGKKHNRNASTGKTFRMAGDLITTSRPLKDSDTLEDLETIENLPLMDDKYYNMLSDKSYFQSGRRHSIGAYFCRKPTVNTSKSKLQIHEETSFSDVSSKVDFKFPESLAPPVDSTEAPKPHKKSCCCRSQKGRKIGMEDIIIISSKRSQAAELWVTYLKTCFDQIRKNRSKPPFRILGIGVEDVECEEKSFSGLEEKLKNSKLVIFIICPVFLEHVGAYPDQSSRIGESIRPDGALAMLLGIGESTVTDSHRTALVTYSQWRRMESVKDRDEKFVGDFLGAAMDIISKNVIQQTQPSEKGSFMLMPKKVNKSQNKVIVMLNEPITKEDVMKVTVIRNNKEFEIESVKKKNPYTLIFRMPEEFLAVSLLVSIRVERNGVDLGTKLLKCESQLYAMAQILKSCDSPVEFMCQALNIVPCDKEKLDEFLVTSFQRNVPPNFNLLQAAGLGQVHRGFISKEEFPTLLHFAAKFGMEKLCWSLLECPAGELVCDIRNVNELTPAEMAENAGHTKLANALCGYMQMAEFSNVYTFLKGMTDEKNSSNKSDTSDDYLNPRPLSETYQVPPSPRPLTQVYSHPPFGYMQMHSPKSSQSSSIFDGQDTARSLGSSKEILPFRKNSDGSMKKIESELHSFKSSRENTGNGIQDELIEIINDFKNNVFTISEVEKLVEDWRNRNDVQQSFKEKQEQLNKMREEYERVQQKLKDEMKQIGRPSPMERIRNFFRSKSKDSKSSSDEREREKKSRLGDNLQTHRPSSGLSIQSSSSSSSGRLSTGSHCSGTSLGDSGTHSDAESERKLRSISGSCCNSIKTKDILDNYDIPPSPVALFNGDSNGLKFAGEISNYDIPSSSLSNGIAVKPQENKSSSHFHSYDSKSNNYYNITGKDVLIPNPSSLHGHLIGSPNRSCCLKAVDESAENKTEETNCYEYINLPGSNAKGDGESMNEGDIQISNLEIQLPDYVNVEKGVK